MNSVKIALIGAGLRSRTIYWPLVKSLAPWIEVVAICDPIVANAEAAGSRLGVPAFSSIRELVRVRPMEAAIVVTPPESHHSISCYLSANGIHNLVETPWASTLMQAREMVAIASRNRVIVRVGENFLRTPIDRIVQRLIGAQAVGPVRRVFSYADHTGYHNNSRWIRFASGHPQWVQSIRHTMSIEPFHSEPQRFHDSETFVSNFFAFPGDMLVVDQMANAKGFLGRHARPGYTEWQGTRGTIVYRNVTGGWGLRDTEGSVRRCSEKALADGRGFADEISPIEHEFDDGGRWLRSWSDTAVGRIEHVNPYRPETLCEIAAGRGEYGSSVMDHIADFAMTIRGERTGEFTEADALMSMMMEVATSESALHCGQRVDLPLDREVESDEIVRSQLRSKYGVDPFDVEAMLAISYPKP